MKIQEHTYNDDDDAPDDIIGRAFRLTHEGARPLSLIGMHDDPYGSRVARVREHLRVLLDDGSADTCPDLFEPPKDLLTRTRNRIREYDVVQEQLREPLMYHPRWRWPDMAVAAAVLFAVFLGTIPALQRSQFASANLVCAANLSQIWKGVELYSHSFNAYPSAQVENHRLPVGATLALLRHTGHLDDSVPLTCPGCSSQLQVRHLPKWNQIRDCSESVAWEFSNVLANAYALHPGVHGPKGVRNLSRSSIHALRAMIPMAGDCPPMDASFRVQSGNSPMHGGHGQNVIFADGHVIFTRSRSLGQIDSDVYANRNGHMSAGIDDNDMILVPGAAILRME